MSEKSKEIAISSTKAILGAIPYFGSALNESIFEHRSRVKQKRINEFILSLSEYINTLDVEGRSTEHISSDEFGDIFEAIIRKVSDNSSRDKAERFKIVLANQILSPSKMDFVDTYIDIISKLNEKQIQILANHKNLIPHLEQLNQEIVAERTNLSKLRDKLEELKEKADKGVIQENESISSVSKRIASQELEIIKLEEKLGDVQKVREADYYNLTDGEFLFCKQDLIAKALLKDTGAGSMGYVQYKYVDITEFGIGLLEFIDG